MTPPKALFRDRICSWLREQGHAATVDLADDGRHAQVRFRARGLHMFVVTDELNPDFLFLQLVMLPRPGTPLALLKEVALEIERTHVVVKIDSGDDGVTFQAEQLLVDAQFEQLFWPCVEILERAKGDYFRRLGMEAPAVAAHSFIAEVARDLGLSTDDET